MRIFLSSKRSVIATMTIGLMLIAAIVHVIGQEPVSGKKENRVKELLNERLTVLAEVAKVQRAGYERGQVSLDSVLAAETDVLLAKLELAATPVERIAIRKSILETARQVEDVTKHLVEAGQGTQVDFLKAKALRLRAEADLMLEQA